VAVESRARDLDPAQRERTARPERVPVGRKADSKVDGVQRSHDGEFYRRILPPPERPSGGRP
jgi:hypothetical protein